AALGWDEDAVVGTAGIPAVLVLAEPLDDNARDAGYLAWLKEIQCSLAQARAALVWSRPSFNGFGFIELPLAKQTASGACATANATAYATAIATANATANETAHATANATARVTGRATAHAGVRS